MISENAITIMEHTAERVGFGNRSDYPHCGKSPISAGDWKGSSIAACVFADRDKADQYIGDCLAELDALGGELTGDVVTVDGAAGTAMYIAIITAYDLVAKN